jgi:hypothetical protein
VATGGARLSVEDLLFSMIKHAYPKAHDYVYSIHNEVGHLMTAPDYVMTAVRLACVMDQTEPRRFVDQPNPDAKQFHRYLKGSDNLLGTAKSPGPLMALLETDETVNPLFAAFKKLEDLLTYRDSGTGGSERSPDIGIPRLMMPHLGRPLIQVLLYWLTRINDAEDSCSKLEASRPEIVRFVLFWFLCCRDSRSAYDASKQAFEQIRNLPLDRLFPFPGKTIFEKLTVKVPGEKSLFLCLVCPDRLEQALLLDASPVLRALTLQGRFNPEFLNEESLFEMLQRFWWKKEMLLWLQRDWLAVTFSQYDALAGPDDRDAVPYDFDHLVPQGHWTDRRNASVESGVAREINEAFSDNRNSVGNAIGNYRLEDGSRNRSDGDDSLSKKMALKSTEKGCRKYYAFEPGSEELSWWRLASPESQMGEKYDIWKSHRTWGEERLTAFQSAVERRTLNLYRRLIVEADFSLWLACASEMAEEADSAK